MLTNASYTEKTCVGTGDAFLSAARPRSTATISAQHYGLGLAYSVDSSGNVQVYHADGHGSVHALTDGMGNLIETYQTDPFGVPTATSSATMASRAS